MTQIDKVDGSSKDLFSCMSVFTNIRSTDALAAGLEKVARVYGFDWYQLILGDSSGSEMNVSPIASNLPPTWWKQYKDKKFSRIDPVFTHCRLRSTPVIWWGTSKVTMAVRVSPDRLMAQAARSGIGSGISFPLRGANSEWGVLSLMCRDALTHSQCRIESALAPVRLLADVVFEAACLSKRNFVVSGARSMTNREDECLSWCAQGKTSWEIAQILGISERTVLFHMQNVSRKLGVANRAQAVAKAISELNWSIRSDPPP
ncbi:helix-turn-helix transcriptional regulator [Denitrobaculum tricleocarpae]|nr:LuxR family transcriptional regulator [Denitrobaculum tricleocarpae]